MSKMETSMRKHENLLVFAVSGMPIFTTTYVLIMHSSRPSSAL